MDSTLYGILGVIQLRFVSALQAKGQNQSYYVGMYKKNKSFTDHIQTIMSIFSVILVS